MSANLYDILDVDETAAADEIRAAWKAAVADLDPTDRRFRAFNDAAAVLLDAAKRAAYDAELAASRDAGPDQATAETTTADTTATDATTADTTATDATTADATATDATAADETATPVALTKKSPSADPVPDSTPPADTPAATSAQAGPPGWALGAAAIGAAVSLVLAVVLLLQPGGNLFSDRSPKEIAATNASFQEASSSVLAAAERLVPEVFSYNYTTMDADLERAQKHVTPELGEKQAAGWPDIAKDAADQKLVVQAKAEAVALTRVSRNGENATVVVFLVQASTRNGVDQTPLRMWVSLDMVRADGSADGWLIDDVCVDSNCDRPE